MSADRCISCGRFVALDRAVVHAESLDDHGVNFSVEFECQDCGGGGDSGGLVSASLPVSFGAAWKES